MNFESMFRAKQEWNHFKQRHPKVPAFIDAVQSRDYCEGMEIAIAVRYPDGQQHKAGIRVTKEDLEMLNLLKTLR
ncbi:MAG: hypothetical protein IJ109_09065 [Firmicutes bacterium]|nr:hypothetical protein [Bacillota bacterium]